MSPLRNFSPHLTLKAVRKMSRKMFDYRLLKRTAKSPLFSAISFAAIFFIVYADSLVSNLSINPADIIRTRETSEPSQTQIERQPMSTFNTMPLPTMQEKTESTLNTMPLPTTQETTEEVDSASSDTLIPPSNVTREERMEWFRRKLPEFQILKSSSLSEQFHGRVLEFFNHECEVQFFMTWISPAKSLGRRVFLAMESLFKVHPRGCLMIISRTMDSTQGYRILKPLLDHGFKVRAVTPDLSFLFKNTPAEAWFNELKSGNKDPGEIPLPQNLSNLIRLAILYKYGGVYLDTDFVVIKSFKGLRNSIGAQSNDVVSKNWTRLNNAVLVFDMNHPLLFNFIQEFASTFDGNKWGHNGPYLVSRVVKRVEGRPGYSFTVLPPMVFYPVSWTRIGGLFKMPENDADSRWVKAKLLQLSGETFGIHLWNKQSSRFKIEEGSVLERLISDHCVICEHTYST